MPRRNSELEIPAPRENLVTCVAIHPVREVALIGFADFDLTNPGLTLFGCGCFRRDGKVTVALPTRPVVSRDGQQHRDDAGRLKFSPVLAFADRQVLTRLAEAVLDFAPGLQGGDR